MPLGVDGTVSSPFGVRGREFHRGVDFGAPLGSPIFSALDGTVSDAGPAQGFGQWIVIDSHTSSGLVSTVYGHMYPAGVLVKKGDTIRAGQRIALVGSNGESTGPHLHFEVWRGGRTEGGAPVDPMAILSSKSVVSPPEGCNASAPITANTVPKDYLPWLQKGGTQCPGLSAPLLAAQIMQESGFRTDAVSPAGARGPAQFMPGTWQSTAVDGDNDGRRDINSVPDAVMSQAQLMCGNLAVAREGVESGTLKGDPVDLALAGYNAGMGAVTSAGGMPSGGQYTTETQPYVARIRSMTSQFSVVMPGTR
ncbi:MAG: M23 family metallopeptidase [Nocardiaceae bacterium]|nr:M23 family metallopeptidase [Nocardiaceae bacterium]